MFNTEKIIRLLLWMSIHDDKKVPKDYWINPDRYIRRPELAYFIRSQLSLEDYLENLVRNNAIIKRMSETLNLTLATITDRLLQAAAYTERDKFDDTIDDICCAFIRLEEILNIDYVKNALNNDFIGCINKLLNLPSQRLLDGNYLL